MYKDIEIEWETLNNTGRLMNRTSRQMVKMFKIGDESDKLRINKATITKDMNSSTVVVSSPSLSMQRISLVTTPRLDQI